MYTATSFVLIHSANVQAHFHNSSTLQDTFAFLLVFTVPFLAEVSGILRDWNVLILFSTKHHVFLNQFYEVLNLQSDYHKVSFNLSHT